MKKHGDIFVTLAGLLVMAVCGVSCAKSHVVPDGEPQEIAVRCPVVKSEAYPDEGIFGIYAYYMPVPSGSNRVENWNASNVTRYLDNVAFRYDGETAVGWQDGGHHPYYWPLSGSLVFAGYSPHMDESPAVTSVSPSENLSSGRPENPHIIIDFQQRTSHTEMVDLLYFTMMSESVSKEDSPVSISFSRALSKVSISFKDPAGYYRIRNVRLKDCINQGKFFAAVESSGWSPVLSALSDYVLREEFSQLSETETVMPAVLPLPQFLDGYYSTLGAGTDKGVSLAFELVDKTNENFCSDMQIKLFPYEDEDGNVVNASLPSRWQMGMHYTYVFTIEADPIEFDSPSVTVEAYVEETPDTI